MSPLAANHDAAVIGSPARGGAQPRICLVHDWLSGYRGGEKCLEAACRLFPEAPIHTLLHVPGSTSPVIEAADIRTSFLDRWPAIGRYYRYALPLMPRAVESLVLPTDVDLVLSFSHAVAKSVRIPGGVPHVCYCFTPMRYAWSRREDYFPSRRNPLRVAARLQGALLDRLKEWDRRTADRVTEYVAVSETVARRIHEAYGRTARVLYPPVETDFFTPADGPRDDYYLCLSALVPYKRVDLAIDACNRLGRRLLVIGTGPERRRLARRAGPTVEFLGWRSAEEVREHLRRCRAVLFPGHEDFGIVPVEAQACGTPVIALAAGGATETILPPGDEPGTGCFFARAAVEDLTAAIRDFERQPERFSAFRLPASAAGWPKSSASSPGSLARQAASSRHAEGRRPYASCASSRYV